MASISDLPSFILQLILLLLPLRDAVRTSVLSKQWRNLWLELDTYELDVSAIPDHVADRDGAFSSLVQRVIFSPVGPGIKVVTLANPGYDGLQAPSWIAHLASGRHRLEQLGVSLGDMVAVPASLFRCATLVDLHLNQCAIAAGDVIDLPLLKYLLLEQVDFDSPARFQLLLDGCPSLQWLDMNRCDTAATMDADVGIDLHHAALRWVSLCNCTGFDAVPLAASAPNLEMFSFFGLELVTIPDGIAGLSSARVNLGLAETVETYHGHAMLDIDIADLGANLARIISGFENVTCLCLAGWCLEYLSTIVDILDLPLLTLKKLIAKGMWPNEGHAGVVVHLIQHSPRLEEIVIENELNHPEEISMDENRDYYPTPPEFFPVGMVRPRRHKQLRRFTMRNFTSNFNEIRLIAFFKASCAAMEMFVVMDAAGEHFEDYFF